MPVVIQSELQLIPNQPMRMLEIAITLESCPQHCFYIRLVLHFQNWCSIWSIYCINGALILPTHKVQFNIYCPILNCTLWVGKIDAPFLGLVLHLEHLSHKWSIFLRSIYHINGAPFYRKQDWCSKDAPILILHLEHNYNKWCIVLQWSTILLTRSSLHAPFSSKK